MVEPFNYVPQKVDPKCSLKQRITESRSAALEQSLQGCTGLFSQAADLQGAFGAAP